MIESIVVKVELNKKVYDEIKQIVEYEFLDNYFNNEQILKGTVEDFIRGAIRQEIDLIKAIGKLNNQKGKLLNTFKNIYNEQDFSLSELSEVTDIAASNLSRILNNQVQPNLDSFLKIWYAFGCPPIEKVLYRLSHKA